MLFSRIIRTRPQLSRARIRINAPYSSVGVVVDQLAIALAAKIACPEHLRVVQVRRVVNPLAVEIEIQIIVNHDQMLSWRVFELAQNGCALQISSRPRWFKRRMKANSDQADDQHGAGDNRYSAHDFGTKLPELDLAQTLNQNQVEQSCARRQVVRGSPDFNDCSGKQQPRRS